MKAHLNQRKDILDVVGRKDHVAKEVHPTLRKMVKDVLVIKKVVEGVPLVVIKDVLHVVDRMVVQIFLTAWTIHLKAETTTRMRKGEEGRNTKSARKKNERKEEGEEMTDQI
jgi:hypothetical protein